MIRRIVPDFDVEDPTAAGRFYGDVIGLEKLMDGGFVETWGVADDPALQVSFATEGGSGTPTPALSIEVDDLDEMLKRARAAGFKITYGPATEPWGVRRFFVRDPFGRNINILSHQGPPENV